MRKILIIGQNSYLGSDLSFNDSCFETVKVLRPNEISNFAEFDSFDFIINFCIQPEHFTQELPEEEMIDVNIAKKIKNPNTKFVFLSSRKVYGSNSKLFKYNEKNELKPSDFYSINKVHIEKILYDLLGKNLLILRTSNIIGPLINKKNTTFLSWLKTMMETYGKIICNINKNVRKDFITKKYFQEALITLISNNAYGIYNVGANFAYTTEELLLKILNSELVEFEDNTQPSDQFILDCSKLHKLMRRFTEEELNIECYKLKEELLSNKFNHQK